MSDRVLAVARARVTDANQPRYRSLVAEIAAQVGKRGVHLWLFRSRSDPDEFLEFVEGSEPVLDDEGVFGGPMTGTSGLLRALATYDSEIAARWDAVSLGDAG